MKTLMQFLSKHTMCGTPECCGQCTQTEASNLDLTDLNEPIANLKKKQKQTIDKTDTGLPGQEIRVQR
jgi:hypothetical protein